MAKLNNAKNKLDEKNVKQKFAARLQTLASAWSKKWDGSLEHSQRLMRLCAAGYFDKGYARWHLINLMNRGVSTVVSYLCEGNPKLLIEPLAPKLKPFAYSCQLILNFLIEKNNFADDVFIPGGTASMFGAGIARTFYEYDRVISKKDEKIKIGTPKVAIIDPADYIGDSSAKHRSDFAMEGDTYRLPTKYAKDLFARKVNGKQIADYIIADSNLCTKYSAAEIAAKNSFDFNRLALEEYTTFMDIYLRDSKTIVTIMPIGKKAKILKEMDWKGPGEGPYDYLGYKYLPGIPVPLPPAWDWYDLDVTMNLMAKTAREQAESQKNIIITDPAGKELGKQTIKAKNMDVITGKNIESIKTLSIGGVNPENYSWLNWAEGEFTKSRTTPDVMRGAGAQAKTLGQEQLIFQNASRIVNNFYTRFQGWMTSILKKWAWAVIESPSTYVEVLDTLKLPGVGAYEYPVVFSKADKVADFYDFVLKIVPYSTQRTSPDMMYQRLFQFMSQWILPTMQLRAQQGSTIDFAIVDRLLADYGGFENFPQWYKSVVPHELSDVNYVMQSKKSPGQGDDSLGSTEPSRLANLAQQQARVGFAGETKKAKETK